MPTKPMQYTARLLPLLLILMLFGGLLPYQVAHADSSIRYQKYPQGTVGIARPVIGVTFRSDVHVTASDTFQMVLDNKKVTGKLDTGTWTYTYTPEENLKPGDHQVNVTLTVQGYQPITMNWTFKVDERTVSTLPSAPTAEQKKAIDNINDYRKLFGLDPLRWSAELTQAAQFHASYLQNNRKDGDSESLHSETSGKPGFSGTKPSERALYANYLGEGVGEDVSFGWSNITQAIDVLFDAPYHRTPFLMQSSTEIGVAREGSYVVLEFGLRSSQTTQMTVSPAHGDHYVPLDFNGHETPDPLAIHSGSSASYPVGYPLMIHLSGEQIEGIKLDEATLTDGSGQPVTLLQNTPGKDPHLDQAIILIPVKPLQPDMQYAAHVKISFTDRGQPKSMQKDWSFHTEPAPTVGKERLHADSDFYAKQATLNWPVSHTVKFSLGEASFTLDDVKLQAKMKPVVIDDSSYLWVRDLARALGASVTWDDARQAAVFTKNGKTITFFTDKQAYAVGETVKETATPAKLYHELTVIPVRLLSEALGAKVQYDAATDSVTIQY
ncbi:stalk domain-containing protein [Gorillibacterium sp. sgz5001074]|uniref:stalk domain-containing protein n=1 Tax=Gorillibacterium sp. sgz5001074 TaxID=3446695 RepID=UPI003F672D1D